MKTKTLLLVAALAATPLLLPAQTTGEQANGTQPPPSSGASGTFHAHVLPPGAYRKLNLTADQQTQLKALEAQVAASLAKILTPAQLEQLNALKPPHHHGPQGGEEGNGNQPPPPNQ